MRSIVGVMLSFVIFLLAPLFVIAQSTGNTWYVGADGWTVFQGSPGTGTCGNSTSNYTGTCVVYVSSSTGDDATCAAQPLPVTDTPAHPCATLKYAQSMLRNNSADWLLLKKGDVWYGGFNGTTGGDWLKNGKSEAEPMLISSYGTGPRPLIESHGYNVNCYGTTHTNGQNMAIVGIECYNDSADPDSPSFLGATATGDTSASSPTMTNMTSTAGIQPGYIAYGSGINGYTVQSVTSNSVTFNTNPLYTASGIKVQFTAPMGSGGLMGFVGGTTFLILENVKTNFGGIFIDSNANAPLTDLRVRRNVIVNGYGNIGHGGGGFFMSDNPSPATKILFEENLIDGVGHNTQVWGAGSNIFSQGFYLHDNNPALTFIGNISARVSAEGAQVRNGGTVINNLMLQDPIGMHSNPGVQANTTLYDYNVITEGNDINIATRTANSATPVGGTTVSIDGILTVGNLNFVNQHIADLDNPGALPSDYITSVTATDVTLHTPVAAGQRGNGVQAGDRIEVFSPRVWGISFGATAALAPGVSPAGATYPIGSTVFYFPSTNPLPSWVVPGMKLGVINVRGAFPNGETTIASISSDRLQLTTSNPSLAAIVGNEQSYFYVWQSPSDSYMPSATFGPHNVITTSAGLYSPAFAFAPQIYSRFINAAGNYYYNWNPLTTQNIIDYANTFDPAFSSEAGTNIIGPTTLNVAGSSAYPNATIEAYDRSIGGPGTAEDFLAHARLQSKDNWDVRYTAAAANNYIRDSLGCNCNPTGTYVAPPPPPPPPPPPTVTLSASPASITAGQSSLLTWSSANATSCSGSNFTASGTSGSISVTPTQTTTYSVTCTGSSGSASASATVTVSPISNSTFAIGTRVKTTANLNVRNKPNTRSGKIICIQPSGALGTITAGPNSANGFTWWSINYDTGCDGWSVQTYLTTSIAYAPESQTASAAAAADQLQALVEKLQTLLAQLQGR